MEHGHKCRGTDRRRQHHPAATGWQAAISETAHQGRRQGCHTPRTPIQALRDQGQEPAYGRLRHIYGDNELQNAPHGMTIRGHTSWLHHGGDGNPSSPFLYSFPKSSALPCSAQQSSFHPSSRQHILYAATRCPSRNHPDTYATTDAAPADRYPDTCFEIAVDRFL